MRQFASRTVLATSGLLVSVGCTQDYGTFDVAPATSGAGGGSASGTGNASSGASASGGASVSGAGATGGGPGSTSASTGSGGSADGGGGAGPAGFCGDGVIDKGEQCDGAGASPFCDGSCVVVCSGQWEVEDLATHHCYYMSLVDGMHTTWQGGRDFCVGWGGDLAVIEDLVEHAFITANLPQDYYEDEWIGGTNTGMPAWVNNAKWDFDPGQPPWAAGEPSGDPCIAINPDGGLRDKSCSSSLTHHMCERAPVGATK